MKQRRSNLRPGLHVPQNMMTNPAFWPILKEDLIREGLVYLNALRMVFNTSPAWSTTLPSLCLILDFLTALDLSVFTQTDPSGQTTDTHLSISSKNPVLCLSFRSFSPILMLFESISPLIVHLSSAYLPPILILLCSDSPLGAHLSSAASPPLPRQLCEIGRAHV